MSTSRRNRQDNVPRASDTESVIEDPYAEGSPGSWSPGSGDSSGRASPRVKDELRATIRARQQESGVILPNFDLLNAQSDGRKSRPLTEAEEKRLQRRRDRNREAAARCRARRRDLAERLHRETIQLGNLNSGLQTEIARLQAQRDQLQRALTEHIALCHSEQ
ncbi:protein fosB-like isoform X1 [Branchiostoma floridae]|uniref:Protein fosB-like isoform X1 n=1 Tax=Branchiostoma floridae TaxID=7739 RepID=A0A9J7KLR2_BRAFL|nr:protein fosB-like isoform X1 [Branchiostoma floridae]XP_035665577.1 protein fosB-like isoform X1 [Branchiostoma floridae]XP_035665578.1 protein fosB-like isoform X1 [Branchiostoma floridae]XP_035665581.1 protein fosB-like isoform X1 [Branchiostoma floridae]